MEKSAMQIQRSLGGIGKLYRQNMLLSEVYYSVKQNQADGSIYGSIVCVGQDINLPLDDDPYYLLLEDKRLLILSLTRESKAPFAPYSFTSCDGILHSAQSSSSISHNGF
jgi:hypothetical protein